MSSSSTSFDYAAVYAFFARFFAIRWRRKEPRLSLDAEEVLTAAYRRIDQQDMEIQQLRQRDELREIEVELLQSEVKWLNTVLHEANIVLSDYDYLRLQQVAIKVRAMRAR